MADMSNEKWLASLRIELLQAGRWVEITSQTADRLEESDRQLAEYRNTPTTDDSDLLGEIDLMRDELRRQRERFQLTYDILASQGISAGQKLDSAVQQLADALTAERAKVAELQHQLETANAANARRAEESQLDPVGFVWRRNGTGAIEIDSEFKGDRLGGVGAYVTFDGNVKSCTTYRVYLGPAEPLEVPQ